MDCETFDGELYQDIPYLDVSSAYREDDKILVINVVNRNMEEAILTQLISDTGEFSGTAQINTINSDQVNTRYTYDEKDNYLPATSTIETNGHSLNYSFPAHSFTQIAVEIKKI